MATNPSSLSPAVNCGLKAQAQAWGQTPESSTPVPGALLVKAR